MSERTYHKMRIYNHTTDESTINQLTSYIYVRVMFSIKTVAACIFKHVHIHVHITHTYKQTHVGHQNSYRDRLARCTLAPTRPHIRDRHF